MTADIVNLRTARKAKARAARETLAAQNRAAFGQSKAERRKALAQQRIDAAVLDGAKRQEPTNVESGDG